MELRTGKVVNGRIVLDDEGALEEGARVQVVVGDPADIVRISDEELAVVRHGQAVAGRGELIDAHEFLAALRAED